MQISSLIDLHCDTLTDCEYPGATNPDTLNDPARKLSLDKIPQDIHWTQFYAIYVPDELRGSDAIAYYEDNRKSFDRQMTKFSSLVSPCRTAQDMLAARAEHKTAAFLTVENGSVLAGDLSRVALLASHGVRCLTLVWNGENEIGSGHTTANGLSDFGRAVIPELERCGILIDVSHLNDAGFEELLGIAQKPFVATHSNARAVCSHKRNLTDEMIREMVRRGCLIGLNYYTRFLRDDGDVQSLDALYAHVERFLELGAGRQLALGSDFDGAALPECLNSPAKAAKVGEYLLSRGISQEQANGIMYKNAERFFMEHLR